MADVLPPPRPLIGRDAQKKHILTLLQEQTLITLTGTAGVGKTSLASALAHDWSRELNLPVYFCALADVHGHEQLIQTVGETCGLARGTRETFLLEHLHSLQALLVLDSVEQCLPAELSFLFSLHQAARLTVLITSRERLNISNEMVVEVPPLDLPSAVELFRCAARPFHQPIEPMGTLVALCRCLDGIPLAIELAAARLQLFSLEEVFHRLQDRFHLLSGGSSLRPKRHQTMRATIDWSYDLLPPAEQALFRCLSAFIGGGSVEAIEAIYRLLDRPENVLDLLASLLNKSLIRREASDGQTRILFFETILEYARERLQEHPEEAQAIQAAHASYFYHLGERIACRVQGLDSMILDREAGNFRTALQWQIDHRSLDLTDVLRMGFAFARDTDQRGRHQEALASLDQCLDLVKKNRTESIPGELLAKATFLAARLQLMLGRGDQVRSLCQQSEELLGQVTQIDSLETALLFTDATSFALLRHRFQEAETYGKRSLAFFQERNRESSVCARTLLLLGQARSDRGEGAPAEKLLREALAVYEACGDATGRARALLALAIHTFYQNKSEQALATLEACQQNIPTHHLADPIHAYVWTWHVGFRLFSGQEPEWKALRDLLNRSSHQFEQMQEHPGLALAGIVHAWLSMQEQRWTLAEQHLRQSEAFLQDIQDLYWLSWCEQGLAWVAFCLSDTTRAMYHFARADAYRVALHATIHPVFRDQHTRLLARLRLEGEVKTHPSWRQGHRDVQHLIGNISAKETHLLTPREREVLVLLAEGLQYKEMAKRLGVSVWTIKIHIQNIYKKLDVSSRSQATHQALRCGILDPQEAAES